ncbi:four helix bundle protein [Mucilaginibacter sp. BJC16-A38]|uniref:four helix bundle protein n=1 Tax=Mucilaginibacter phenanthrenivorans TaxID=1234842 RepID=UPI00215772F6|nr:four helix bundle protein [Mucilaginibacter phenanthrenivorans]MCR8560542.1 four helix bundle protein [Mucilaginibacter phenanthrenivorans]
MTEDNQKVDFAEMMRNRTKKFVVDNIKFYRTLPKTEEAKIIGRQLLRSSSSVGANYRAACRARSKAEFHSKLSIVVEEADESVFWMEILVEAEVVKPSELDYLSDEASQILKIVSASRKTVSSK